MAYHISLDVDLKRNSYKGLYIALEGIDGSGKTTQTEKLRKYFEKLGRKVVLAKSARRDKGFLAEINEKIIKGKLDIPKSAFQYLFTADYIIQTEQIVIPALKRGDVVIADRFHCWSSVAYGIWENSRGKNYDVTLAKSILLANGLLSKAYQLMIPDITFFLNASTKTGMKRVSKEKEEEIYEKKDIFEKVIIGYKWLIKEFPKEFVVLDAEKTIGGVFNQAKKYIDAKIK